MPLYEYQCKQCGHRFEKIQSFSAPEEKVCPSCGGEVERLISAPAIQFKGAGWYVNDYGGRGKAPSASASEASSKDGAKDSGGKDVSAKSSDSSAKSEASKSDSGGKSDSGAASSSSGSNAASSSNSGSNAKSSS
ncbi:MAG: FmdB family zinc ribbon protein [Acidobacteriaceae bacterium]